MQTFPLIDPESGTKYAFEVENAYIGPQRIAKLLAEAPDVLNVKSRRLFGSNPDTHVIFDYKGSEFMVWEPYGDNSRYWIGPRDKTLKSIDVTPIEQIFQNYCPPLIRRAIGNVLSLRFLRSRESNQSPKNHD